LSFSNSASLAVCLAVTCSGRYSGHHRACFKSGSFPYLLQLPRLCRAHLVKRLAEMPDHVKSVKHLQGRPGLSIFLE
jgi:hypothetical protein